MFKSNKEHQAKVDAYTNMRDYIQATINRGNCDDQSKKFLEVVKGYSQFMIETEQIRERMTREV